MAKAIYREPDYRTALAYWVTWMATKPWTCRRCGRPIPPGHRHLWDLGHPKPYEPEHRGENRAGGARTKNTLANQPASRDC